MPDDVPDYERWFFRHFGMTFEEGIAFLQRRAVGLTCSSEKARDLVHDFLADELLPQLRKWYG